MRPWAVDAASRLTTRALVAVYLAVARERLTDDHWIYVPDPTVAFCRLSETVNYSEAMAPPGRTGVCAEIACRAGTTDGYTVSIPEFGTIYIAQVIMKPSYRRVSMLRFELGWRGRRAAYLALLGFLLVITVRLALPVTHFA